MQIGLVYEIKAVISEKAKVVSESAIWNALEDIGLKRVEVKVREARISDHLDSDFDDGIKPDTDGEMFG